jgi:hypothetical protein
MADSPDLTHQNRRPEYLDRWWSIANWQEAARRFRRSDHAAEPDWEDEGGRLLAA